MTILEVGKKIFFPCPKRGLIGCPEAIQKRLEAI
jgi:hypothetical protein